MNAEQIKQKRLEKGWSKYRLAKELDVHWDTIHRWENDEHSPDAKSTLKLAKILGLEVIPK
jgi:ribosome-binding protein aMBF1 (putative translation factor)